MTIKEKRKKIEEMVYKTFEILDKTGENTERYKTFFRAYQIKNSSNGLKTSLKILKKIFS